MNISKDGKTLYFSDDEIDSDTNGEKKVFVTKRINGQESHIKAKKVKNILKKQENIKENEEFEEENIFNFDTEKVLGVTSEKEEKKERNKPKKRKEKHAHKKEGHDEPKKDNEGKKNQPKLAKKGHKKKKKVNKKIVMFFSLVFLVAAIVILALTAPIFNITQISVNGNSIVSSDTITILSGIKKGENIFKFNNSAINKIKENNYIEKAEIKRTFPDKVTIAVEERKPKYQINLINSYVYIDKNGYILENSSEKKPLLIIVGLEIKEDEMLNEKRLKTNDLEKLSNVSKIMEAAKAIKIEDLITEINTEDDNNYVLYLESKSKKIYIGSTVNLTNKMLYIQKIIENEEGKSGSVFVNGDLSAGFKPYFREE